MEAQRESIVITEEAKSLMVLRMRFPEYTGSLWTGQTNVLRTLFDIN